LIDVLVDTSVWIDHFRNGNGGLIKLLTLDHALTHPMVIGEIACGTPPAPRTQTLANIGLLRRSHQASIEEVSDFIEREKLSSLECGLVDLSLLASTLITPKTQFRTLDKRLEEIAAHFNVSYGQFWH
jgi:predicted nucleic acid-binding protein